MTDRPKSPIAESENEARREMTFTMLRLVRGIRAIFDCGAQELGLTYARAQAILAVSRKEGMNQTCLAEILEIETPTLNRTLDGLEKLGFLERRPAPEDKRVRQIYLTDHARENAARIEAFTEDLRARLYDGVTPEELEQTQRTLTKMASNLEEMRAR